MAVAQITVVLKTNTLRSPMPGNKNQREGSNTPDELAAEIARLTRQNASLKREIARLEVYRAMAYRDPLTGLWNRRYCEERLAEEFSRCRRSKDSARFSVLLIDINDFKSINDLQGHAAGDEALRWAGEFLIGHLRTHDVACRTGGDEFTVILPDLSETDCALVISRLRDELRAANLLREIPVGMSIGSASWQGASDSPERMLMAADEAMYTDKRTQREQRRGPDASPHVESIPGGPGGVPLRVIGR